MRQALLLSCPDRPGIVAGVAGWIASRGGNMVEADQHTDTAAGLFLQRIVFDAELTAADTAGSFAPIAADFDMDWQAHDRGGRPEVIVLASREAHCAYDLLARFATDDLPGRPRALISNHATLESAAERFGVEFHHLAVPEDLDEGPIIAQDVTAVSHRDSIDDLRRRGRDLETVVLARAVRLHLEHRVLTYANRTAVFD